MHWFLDRASGHETLHATIRQRRLCGILAKVWPHESQSDTCSVIVRRLLSSNLIYYTQKSLYGRFFCTWTPKVRNKARTAIMFTHFLVFRLLILLQEALKLRALLSTDTRHRGCKSSFQSQFRDQGLRADHRHSFRSSVANRAAIESSIAKCQYNDEDSGLLYKELLIRFGPSTSSLSTWTLGVGFLSLILASFLHLPQSSSSLSVSCSLTCLPNFHHSSSLLGFFLPLLAKNSSIFSGL